MRTLEITEFNALRVPEHELSRDDGKAIWERGGDRLRVEFPSPRTDFCWEFESLGWVGTLPVTPDLSLSLLPKVPLANLFRMLEYAYNLKSFHLLEGDFQAKSVQDLFDRLAGILARRVLARARRGLYSSYVAHSEHLPYVRGAMDLPNRLRRPWETRLTCHYQEHTADVEENRILAWTLGRIAQSGICSERTLPVVRQAFHTLHGAATPEAFGPGACIGRLYNRLNDDYAPMHGLCRFFLENTGPTHEVGDRRMIPFLVNMARLFELFVSEWLRAHLPPVYHLRYQEQVTVGANDAFSFQVDMTVRSARDDSPICALDAKYKTATRPAPEDVYQAVTYAETLGCHDAVLIYPMAAIEPFDELFRRNRVRSVAFALDQDLDIAGQALIAQWLPVVRA